MEEREELQQEELQQEELQQEESQQILPQEEIHRNYQEDIEYTRLYNPNKNKKKNNSITIILVALLLLLLVASLIAAVSQVVKSVMVGVSTYTEENGSLRTKIEEYLEKQQNEDSRDAAQEWKKEIPDEEMAEERDEDGRYVPSESDPYYVEITDSIRDDLSYQIDWETYEFTSEENDVEIDIVYPVIIGDDVRNIEVLNREIKNGALYYLKNYANNPENGNVSDCTLQVTSYVTFMDEEVLSIVVNEEFEMQGISTLDLYCINIDLLTGQLMDNSKILDYSVELAKEFRKNSNFQNGQSDAIDALSDEELQEYLSGRNSGIIFYTPIGMEIGFNYSMDNSYGWITATVKDYDKYIRKM